MDGVPDGTRLIAEALKARDQAYAPYSRFAVGAALLVDGGQVYRGCNVENASYGLTLCAERTAVGTALSAGSRSWVAMAVAAEGRVPPCGACCQVLAEFAPGLVLFLVDAGTDEVVETTLAALLPNPFRRP